MQRKFEFTVGEYYHIYNRGTDKRNIFMDNKDLRHFLDLLYLCNGHAPIAFRDITQSRGPSSGKISKKIYKSIFDFKKGDSLVDIGAYCLMPNHFHLILREKEDRGVSIFMKKMLTAYSMYFNKRRERKGALFEGRFKAIHIDTDEYFQYLFAYIHLNPIKLVEPNWKEEGIKNTEKATSFLGSYKYSSYLDSIGVNREDKNILNRKFFPEYFSTPKEHQDFVEFWLKNNLQIPEDRPREK